MVGSQSSSRENRTEAIDQPRHAVGNQHHVMMVQDRIRIQLNLIEAALPLDDIDLYTTNIGN